MADPNSKNSNSLRSSNSDGDEYPFIKETIKKSPSQNGKILRRLVTAAICVLLFILSIVLILIFMISKEEKSLSNASKVRYIGIEARTISEDQSDDNNLPQGIYIDAVDENSPAMSAGLQSGDILHNLAGTEIDTFEEYDEVLQELSVGESYKIKVYRQDPSGEYVNVVLNITIEGN